MTSVSRQPGIVNQKKVRKLSVVRTEPVGETMLRVTLGGEDLEGWSASGPADHVKLFFPDPVTGELLLPEPGRRAGIRFGVTAQTPVRDYTPLASRTEAKELDIDFVLHDHGGPAASWAGRARVGDTLGMGGPGRSEPAPLGITDAVLGADETALPAVKRWIEALEGLPTTVFLSVSDPALESYFDDLGLPRGGERQYHWFFGQDRESEREKALRDYKFTNGSFAYLAGEAGTIIPLRRYLRRELGLDKAQVQAEGFWKQGVSMLDHHQPVDPTDPD